MRKPLPLDENGQIPGQLSIYDIEESMIMGHMFRSGGEGLNVEPPRTEELNSPMRCVKCRWRTSMRELLKEHLTRCRKCGGALEAE